MTHIITGLCLRDGACVEVCPVECIIPGQPEDKWPWYFIDPETCIDCGACVPECPFEAIFPEEDVPDDYEFDGEVEYAPFGGERFTPDAGTVMDLTPDGPPNYHFFGQEHPDDDGEPAYGYGEGYEA